MTIPVTGSFRIACVDAPRAMQGRFAGTLRGDEESATDGGVWGGGVSDPALMDPALGAPLAVYLAHEDCPVTSEIYAAGAPRFARMFIASTAGHVHDGPPGAPPTPEDVAEHWAAINDESSYPIPVDLIDWSTAFLDHLGTEG